MAADLDGYSQVPAVLLLADVSDRAVRLWAVLDCHQRGRTVAWPSRATLQALLRCSADSVDRAVVELENSGLVVVQRRADKGATNRYSLRGRPRDGAAGSRTGAASASRSDAATDGAGSRTGADRVAAPVRPKAEERNRDTTSTTVTAPAADESAADGGGGEEQLRQAEHALLAAVPASVRQQVKPSPAARRCIATATEKGWTVDQLQAVAAEPWDGAARPAAVWLTRLRECSTSTPPPPVQDDQAAPRPACGHCSPTRRLEDPDDGADLGPCPRCHWSLPAQEAVA